jgi:hypothetical protein
MAHEMPTLTLRLKNEEAEKLWTRNFNCNLIDHDRLATKLNFTVAICIFLRNPQPELMIHAAIELVAFLFLLDLYR